MLAFSFIYVIIDFMNVNYTENSIYIITDRFDIAKTFECGQCFRFGRNGDGSYSGIACGRALTLYQREDGVYVVPITALKP